ncbi:MAG TPA: SMC-Scp complex subunit ScpB, partial [Polyangia bacterium]
GDLPPGAEDDTVLPTDETRLQSIVESLLFATDRALGIADLKRLLNERDGKRITAALEALRERRADSGIQLISAAGGWQLRTHPANGAWVAKLVAGRPQRLSRAMMETLAIVAYRQPITRPEIDEIRGVDCGPVLRTLLDRSLVRVIGKKEEVGRPLLYGTTPEFLKTFSLRDLTELPTLRDFHELGAAERAEVDAVTSARGQAGAGGDLDAPLDIGALRPSTVELPNVDPDEEEALLEELEQATQVAGRATAATVEPTPAAPEAGDAGVEAAGRSGTDGGER